MSEFMKGFWTGAGVLVAGLNLNMGLGGGGGYSGPSYGGASGPAGVPGSSGYPDTNANALLAFGPTGVTQRGRNPAVHSLAFGVACFAALVFFAWALPR